jgi:hypothetical protein
MCGGLLVAGRAASESLQLPNAKDFSLATLMMVVTGLLVGLGVMSIVPYMGLIFGIAIVPAIMQSALFTRRQLARTDSIDLSGALHQFSYVYVSTIISLTVALGAASVAFFVSCLGSVFVASATGPRYPGPDFGVPGFDAAMKVGLVVGLLAGLPVLVLTLKAFWPKRNRQP